MRRPGWFDRDGASPLVSAALLPLVPLSWLYRAAAALHRAATTRGWRAPVRLPCKVISVGNLVVGGSGKTPVAARLAVALKARGHRVAIVSRGYGGRGRDAVRVVSDGRFVRGRASVDGEEPLWLAGQAPGIPVLVGRDRATVGRRAIAAFGAELRELDDGFQHHRLARDLDLVVSTGSGGLGNRQVLPRGPLREGLAALRHADAIGVVDGPADAADEAAFARHAPHAFRFEVTRTPRWLKPLGTTPREAVSLDGREVGMICGLARPAAFRDTLEGLGASVVTQSGASSSSPRRSPGR